MHGFCVSVGGGGPGGRPVKVSVGRKQKAKVVGSGRWQGTWGDVDGFGYLLGLEPTAVADEWGATCGGGRSQD